MSKLWLRLDNAALIFPAVRRKGWSNVFRLSATLTEEIDPLLLQQAVNALKPRFPSMYVRLRTGLFWYYLEEAAAPAVRQDYAFCLRRMPPDRRSWKTAFCATPANTPLAVRSPTPCA